VANPAGDALSPEQIQRIINEAVDATKSAWGYCPKCREKVKADFPDHNGRINALKLALEHGYGKPGTSKDETKVDLDVDITTLTPEARVTLRKQLVTITGITHKQDGTLLLNRSAPRTRPESPPIP
jgi:hypothetical protein